MLKLFAFITLIYFIMDLLSCISESDFFKSKDKEYSYLTITIVCGIVLILIASAIALVGMTIAYCISVIF